jgi:hypothetical protein
MTALIQLVLLAVFWLSSAVPSYSLESLCGLTSETGIVYSLDSLDTLSTSIVKLPTPGSGVIYDKAYINFCEVTSDCEGAYACLVSSSTGVILKLCESEPEGDFIFDESPQVGATFSCSSTPGAPSLNGVVSSAVQSNISTTAV